VAKLPSMKCGALLAVLQGPPLNYLVVRQRGSHMRLEAEGRPPLTFAFHDGVEVPRMLVYKILVKTVGLTEDEASALV
jgi:predicted RNA binding protein YcfA (HicA-like mRNA interferase family)